MNYVIENKLETRQRLPNNLEKAFLGFTMKMLKKSNKNAILLYNTDSYMHIVCHVVTIVILSVYKVISEIVELNTIVILFLLIYPIISELVMLFSAIYKISYVIGIEEWRILKYKIDNGLAQVTPSL